MIFSSELDLDSFMDKIKNIDFQLTEEDSKFEYNIEVFENKECIKESQDVINLLTDLKNGLLETYSSDGFPLLSANIGKVSNEEDSITIKYSIRSSDELKENELINETKSIANKYEFEFIIDSKKPFFPFKENSQIRKILQESYHDLYGKETTVKKIHACMEGGILSNNIKDLDICTIAPTIENCHSVNENVSISSTERVYRWIKDTLQRFNKI